MANYLILHIGFEKPDDAAMAEWDTWFQRISDIQQQQLGLMNGQEISSDGIRELGWDLQSMTGCNIIEAESLEAAIDIAKQAPRVTATRVYELR